MNGIFDPSKFIGQAKPVEDNYTKTPNWVIDDEIMAQLNDKAFKCYMLINRYTTGYNKASAQIATSTFKKYCGIKKDDTVYALIRELEQLKLIKVERSTGVLNTYFLLNNHPQETVLPLDGTTPVEGEGTTPVEGEGTTPVEGEGTTPVEGEGTTPVEGEGTTPVERDSYKENSKENFKENISAVFEHWKTTFGKTEKVVLSDKRKAKIQARLKQGYTVDDIKHAILNCSKSDYHLQNGYTDIELICREPEKLDRFIAMFPRQTQNPTQPQPEQQIQTAPRPTLVRKTYKESV